MTGCFKDICVSRHVAHDAQVSETRRTGSLRHIGRSHSLYCYHRSNGLLDSMHGYEARGSIPGQGAVINLQLFAIYYFLQFINLQFSILIIEISGCRDLNPSSHT